MNTLYYGDNLDILRDHIPDESVDLIYLDPPFNSNRSYNLLFKERTGVASAAQLEAFDDTWHWSHASEAALLDIFDRDPDVYRMVDAIKIFLGSNDMMAYLVMMAQRLIELHRVLKPTGSIYLHCDPTASHYLKILLDSIFGASNFVNDISWKRTTTKNDYKQGATNWPRVHDVILYYHKDARRASAFNQPFAPYDARYVQSKYPHADEHGRRYGLWDLTAPGSGTRGHPQYELMGVRRYWRYNKEKMEALVDEGRVVQPRPGAVPRYKRYLDEMPGIAIGDVWDDISPINSQAAERLGYPTQKPLTLLERIIQASSTPGDVVLDPFCGCGTAIAAAERLGRKWIGIDITYLAIAVMKQRLDDHFPYTVEYQVLGDPRDVESARDLFQRSAHQFQWWVVDKVGGRQAGGVKKKGADRGIDGELYFLDETQHPRRAIIQVKGGRTSSGDVRDFRGTMEREKVEFGVFISFDPPTSEMKREAVMAGVAWSNFSQRSHARIQFLSVEDLLQGRRPDIPHLMAAHQNAPRLRREAEQAHRLELPMMSPPRKVVRE